MVNTELLMDTIKNKNESVESVARRIGIDKSTLYRKIAKGGKSITLQEADAIKKDLSLDKETAEKIFFADELA